MSYTYRLNPLILQDYEAAYSWYEDKLTGLGERFAEAVRVIYKIGKTHKEIYISSIHHNKKHPRNKYRK